MNPEIESFKRSKQNSKPYPKNHHNNQNSPKTNAPDSSYGTKQTSYEQRNFYERNDAQTTQFQRPYLNRNSQANSHNQYNPYNSDNNYKESGYKESHKESGIKDTVFKGMIFDINGEKLKIHHNDNLNDSIFTEKVENLFKRLKIPKRFEEEALMIKIVKELEKNGWSPMEKWKYNQILDSFIYNSVNLI